MCYAGNVKRGQEARRRAPFSAEALRSMREAVRAGRGASFVPFGGERLREFARGFYLSKEWRRARALYRGPGSWPMREVWAPRRDRPPQRALDAGRTSTRRRSRSARIISSYFAARLPRPRPRLRPTHRSRPHVRRGRETLSSVSFCHKLTRTSDGGPCRSQTQEVHLSATPHASRVIHKRRGNVDKKRSGGNETRSAAGVPASRPSPHLDTRG